MGIRSEIKDVLKLHEGCVVGHHEALNAITQIVNRPKAPKPAERVAQAFEAQPTGECFTIREIFIITNTQG